MPWGDFTFIMDNGAIVKVTSRSMSSLFQLAIGPSVVYLPDSTQKALSEEFRNEAIKQNSFD